MYLSIYPATVTVTCSFMQRVCEANNLYIAVIKGDSRVQIFTVAEQNIMEESDDFFSALQALIASYFVFLTWSTPSPLGLC